jgi:hypothetical protein
VQTLANWYASNIGLTVSQIGKDGCSPQYHNKSQQVAWAGFSTSTN